MASYSQWARHKSLGRLIWLCGSERMLCEEIVSYARSQHADVVTLVAGDDAERDIWALCAQIPADREVTRLVVVRCAQRLKRLQEIEELSDARDLHGLRVLFHSEDADFPQARTDDGAVLVPPLARLRDSRSGQIIRCGLSDESADWVVAWASAQLGGAGAVLGSYLLEATGHDLTKAANCARKLALARIPVTRDNIALVAQASPEFVDAVLAGRRTAALEAATRLTHDQLGRIIGLLALRLDTLGALYAAKLQGLTARETAIKAGVPTYLQQQYKEAAASYTPARVEACRAVLAVADDAWHSGVTEGLPEAIAVLWAA